MEPNINEDIINKHKEHLINIQKRNINALGLGIVVDNCNTMLYSILIHCIENINIFDKNQIININNFINKLNYVG